jgi:predicted P-loop ATPase
MKLSIIQSFNNVVASESVSSILESFKDGKYRASIEPLILLYQKGDKSEYNKLKKKLLGFTPSGIFESKRKSENLSVYSNLIILDIDNLDSENIILLFDKIKSSEFTYACFKSPSHHGLKILVHSDNMPHQHLAAFNEIKSYYENFLDIQIDPSGKDIARLCFFSWDPDLYVNQYSNIFKTKTCMIEEEIEILIKKIENNRIDITNSYENWLNIGFALCNSFGESGRTYFHRLSSISNKYNQRKCEIQYNNCLKSGGTGITLKTLFFIAKNAGVDIAHIKSCYPDNSELVSNKTKQNDSTKKNDSYKQIESYLKGKYDFRYNLVLNKIEIKRKKNNTFKELNDYIENSLFRELLLKKFKIHKSSLSYILDSDFSESYNPFNLYLSKLPKWDGTNDYILDLAKSVSTHCDKLWYVFFKKWLVAAVASIVDDNVVNHTAIILSGGQGLGKTTWLNNLCPNDLKSYVFSGTINPNNKDTLSHLSECIFINMDELENMNRTEIGVLKEIITKGSMRLRKPYGRHNQNFVRRASFMGSVNVSQFLNDPTGSRRFLCFEVSKIDYSSTFDMDLVFAQAYSLYQSGFKFYFDKEEIDLVNSNNEQFSIRTVEEEMLLTHFKPIEPEFCSLFLTASQINTYLAERSRIQVSTGSAINVGKILKKHNFIKKKRNGIYVWAVEEIKPDMVTYNNSFCDDLNKESPL